MIHLYSRFTFYSIYTTKNIVHLLYFYDSLHKATSNRVTKNFCLVHVKCFQETGPQDSLCGRWEIQCSHVPGQVRLRVPILKLRGQAGSVEGSFRQTQGRLSEAQDCSLWPPAGPSQPMSTLTASGPDGRLTTLHRSFRQGRQCFGSS